MARAPRGFFLHRVWVPTACTLPPPHVQLWEQCLRDTTVILAGDSNLLMWFTHLQKRLNCLVTRVREDTTWHTPVRCVRTDMNFLMLWHMHGYPQHPTSGHWADVTDFRSACQQIDEISHVGRYLVVVHLYIHFTLHHYSVFADRMKCVRRSVKDLLNRNPQAKVMIRAPHTSYKGWNPIYGGDMIMHIYIEILRREFRGLYDRVIFLNLWDMTVAGENTSYHPNDWIDQEMVSVMLGYACNS